LNLQCRTLFQLVIQLSILFRIFWCNIALQQRIYEVWYIDPVRSTISARLQELCIFNWQFPTEHILTHDCSITTGSVCYDIQFNRECHSPNFCTFQSDVERLKRQEVNNCQVCWIIWKPTTSMMVQFLIHGRRLKYVLYV
jgi:hypothetical protein